ncbi:hypothetical protein [Tritonibacter mobilis]|uniref:hypothetical protein n=1 Tax=Tritonibacter mobilis TaxID=379347 RepID=UPI001CDA06C4|nr:hypothetical protein [Tritonibacter mobilis]MCA2009157.1 hypothetical protein [Tritonibacter mobilis]
MDDLPFDKVFAEQDGQAERFPGFLLADHGKHTRAEPKVLAWVYAEATLRSINFGLENLDTPEAGYPGLFMARHTLELYLKGLVPDWKAQRPKGKNRHAIDYLEEILSEQLKQDYDEREVQALSKFLIQFSMLDPKSTAFRYQDGAVVSLKDDPLSDPEIWIDFQALKQSLSMIFEALDKIWGKQNSKA